MTWHKNSENEYREYIASEWFFDRADFHSVEYNIVMKDGRKLPTRCTITVSGNEAMMDYAGVHAEHNTANAVDIGQSRVTFQNGSYERISKYEWRPEGKDFILPNVVPYFASGLEGDPISKVRSERKRDRRLVREKVASLTSQNKPVSCEACSFDFSAAYPDLGHGFCEVHHRKPLGTGAGERVTKLDDLAVLCANCHRMVHRAMGFDPDITLSEFTSRYVSKRQA